MYTNGLKDRYGSPLLSLDVGDERYVRMNQIEFEHNKLEEKITLLDRNVQHNADDITKANDRLHNINVTVKNHNDDQNIHFTEGEKKDFHNVASVIKNNKNVFDENITEYTEYDNNIFPFAIEGGDNTFTSSVRYDYKHLPKGVIKSVSFLARDSSTLVHDSKTNGCYLLANVYKKDGTLVRSHGSINKVVVVEKQSSDAERPLNTWFFDGIPSIEEDEIIKFIPSPNGVSQKSNYVFGIRVDTTHTHDDCQVGGDSDFENNPLGVGTKNLAFAKFGGDFYYRNSKAKELKPYEKTFLQSLYTKTSVKLFDNNVNNENLGVGSVKGWILERPYITNGIFNEIRWTSVGTVSWTENGQTKSTTGIAITLRDKYGKNIKTLFSNNTENFSAQGLKSFRFNEEFEIDDNIGSILIQTSTDGSTISTVAQCRVRVVGNATKPNADGSETTNNNFVIHCEFWGNNVSLGGDILTTTQANSTFATKEELGGYVANETLEDYATTESLGGYVSKEEFDLLVEQTKQKQQYYDTWTNLKDGYFVDKAACYSFQLDKLDFVSGRIDRIEIPYAEGANAEGHLCVQFFDSSNSVIATHYSINTQKQDKTGNNVRGICEFEFMTFETPDEYSYVRFSMVANTTVVPTGNSGKQFRMMPIGYGTGSNRFLWNPNTNTKINNTGLAWTILLSVLTRKIGKDTGITIRQYDWTPDVFCPINVTLSTAGNAFVAPTNGWIVSKSTQTTSAANSLTLNGIEIGASGSTAQADLQVLMRKGEFITATTAYNLVFFPCKSEQFDYRLENTHTKYDIWKGAIMYDENGESIVQDLYIPYANTWKNEVGHEVIGRISTIVGEQAYDSNGYVLFNIQSQYIENGNYMFIQSSITSFDADLGALTSGAQMFAGARLTSWNTDLPSLTSGETMFYACPTLSSFRADVHSLTTGWNMFMNCSNLTTVSFVDSLGALTKLDALTNGTGMFKGCSLSYTSLNNILAALPTRNGNVIEITVADSVKDDMLNDPQWEGVSIPAHNSGNYYGFTHNGWNVRLTSRTGFTVSTSSSYDVSEVNGYIPDASQWNSNVYDANNLNIVSVVDGVAYDELV